ncbi:GntR family transcriptional regulator [Alicyclobacillus cellulosilyticus]|uniref:GntR family transcriptional regulator n=1 Tax=Alicyclobacillus cellulosilyticus TaxID=1003997 RepID=A0A917KC82_9BACL|nr:GntR family transcriptional regulator [Alicyclobacillus cellulosilyticus]GGJ05709.1 GntR family transcriptional regulator [Alicyclobacillus cellulosilyticus]
MAGGSRCRQPLYAQVAEEMRALIEAGVYGPGDRLPPLPELAVRFGCSRATVREALGTLRGQGLVEFRPGDGTYVKRVVVESWMKPLEAAILLGQNHVEQLLGLAIAVLAGVAWTAARNHRRLDTGLLAARLFDLECADPLDETAISAELAFYLALAEAIAQPVFENTVRVLQEVLRSSLRAGKDARRRFLGVDACRAVYDAVVRGDPAAARDAVYAYGEALMRHLANERVRAARRPLVHHRHEPAGPL